MAIPASRLYVGPCLVVLLGTFAVCADDAALARQARGILQKYCHRCHGLDGASEGGFNYVLDAGQLVNRKTVLPKDAASSKLFKRVTSTKNRMPPEDEPAPSGPEIATLKAWIEAGAPAFREQAQVRTFIAFGDTLKALRADLATRPERDRRFTRYFTLTHLYNAGLSPDELTSYRHGLSKLINSLSWSGNVAVPEPIDVAQTVLRIDLRNYQWTDKTWDTIVAANPYGVLTQNGDLQALTLITDSKLPVVRADWFVATASRPPLYHTILGLPGSVAELEKMLRIDAAEDIRQERVARAGFNGSGVSRNNRLIERHEAGGVTYWKSYDFASNVGRQNLFAVPLGPGAGDRFFQPDGGEIIFTLPNGLQGYFLANAKGDRIDKGPTAIVSDPRRPDRAVENGLSCMSCHSKGLIPKTDQIREHVGKNAQGFVKSDMESVLALYPPADKLAALIQDDAKRFQEAVARTGAPLTTTEPIAALAMHFEAEMDLPLAAAEAHAVPEEFLAAINRSPRLVQVLGALKIDGGTVQRQVYVNAYPEVIRALRLGAQMRPSSARYGELVAQGEELGKKGEPAAAVRTFARAVAIDPDCSLGYHRRAHAYYDQKLFDAAISDYATLIRLDPFDAVAFNNRGLAYVEKGDPDLAIRDFTEAVRLDPTYAIAYHNRGLAHRKRSEFDKAIADYTEALRIDPEYVLAYHNRAAAYYARKDLDRAIEDYSEVLKRNPESVLALNNRGYAYLDKKEFDRAVADFTAAVRLDEKFAPGYHNRGLAYYRQGDYDLAIADFTEALRCDPHLARSYWQRSLAYGKKGDATRAASDREQALKIDPTIK